MAVGEARAEVRAEPRPSFGPALGPALTAALAMPLIALLAIVLTISFSAIIFTGPLAPFLSQGIGLGLFGGVVLGIVTALGASYRGTICQPQDVTAVILSLSAAAIAARLAGGDPERLYATVAVLIAVAALATGLVFIAAGVFRLGFLARFIPYPVLGGFLAATGYLVLTGGAQMMLTPGMAGLAAPEAVARWLPVVGFAALMVVVLRWSGSSLALPVMLVLAFAGFYGGLAVFGVDLEEAGRMGLLLGPFEADQRFWGAFHVGLLAEADYGAILAETPAILTLVGLALVGALLNASGIELATGEPVDLNRDLRAVGAANVLAAGGGGLVGYHILAETLLAQRLSKLNSRWIGVTVGLTSAVALVAGAQLLALLPIGVFAAVLVFLGIELLYEWLWVERRRMPLPDFAIVVLILGTAATIGFLQAVAVGILAASVLFLIAYARLDVVRAQLTGALRLSTTERAEPAVRRLVERGDETRIFELQGYVFFGTAHALLAQLSDEIRRPDATIRTVIVDFRRVEGLDVSAVFNFGKLEQICRLNGVRLIFAGLRPALLRPMELAGLAKRVETYPALDDALAAVEEALLAGAPVDDGGEPGAIARLLERAAAAGLADAFALEPLPAGAVLFEQGEPSDCLVVLESGRLSARVAGPKGGAMRVATFLPGAVVGEIGLYAGTPRTATVAAEVDSTIRRVTEAGLERLSASDPALARDLHRQCAALLARRLTRTTALLREVGR